MHANWLSKMIFLSMILLSFNLQAQVLEIVELSNGACWVNFNKENLKLASFNEGVAINYSFDKINSDLVSLVNSKKFFTDNFVIKEINYGIHCGAYGSSLIAKIYAQEGVFCAWLKPKAGGFEIRSFGMNEKADADFCDGEKWGEFIVGVKSNDAIKKLKSPQLKDYIKDVVQISQNSLKIVLNENYAFKENEAIKAISREVDFSYVEMNSFMHPVGEFLPIK